MKKILTPSDLTSYQREVIDILIEKYPTYDTISIQHHEVLNKDSNKELNCPIIRRLFIVNMKAEEKLIMVQLIPPSRMKMYNKNSVIGSIEYRKTQYLVFAVEHTTRKRGLPVVNSSVNKR